MIGVLTMFAAAKSYIERGWSVIPLIGKKPALPSWKEYQEHPPTLGTLTQWFGQQRETRYNIGVVTGSVSGIVVVDADTREDAVWWWQNRPRTGLISRTGRGVHFWYKYAPARNMAHFDGRGVDVRGDGGYVVAPPSIHPTGKQYEWTLEGEMIQFDPEWISTPPVVDCKPTVGRNVETARAYIAAITAISGHGGHAATFRAACKLRDFGLSESATLAELIRWNENGNAQPPWKLDELLHKVRDAFKAAEVQG